MEKFEMEPYEFYKGQVIKDENNDYHIELITVEQMYYCPYCGSEDVVKNGASPKNIRDLNMFGGRVELCVDNPRYKCKECKRTFLYPYESIAPNQRMTLRLRNYIKEKSLMQSFTSLEDELGISDTIIKRLFMERIGELDAARKLKAPRVLGIDENHLHRVYRAVFTDVENGRILEILPDRNKVSIRKFIQSLPGYEGIKCFTMDMWRPYRDAVYELLPNAVIVVDKFHVIKQLNYALESIRVSLRNAQEKGERRRLRYSRFNLLRNFEDLTQRQRNQLEDLFLDYPQFETPYYLKEEFRSIYNCHTRAEAQQAYQMWKQHIKGYKPFEDVADTIDEWHYEVFNYFVFPYTNAVTESLNKVINDIDNKGKGYTFDILRAKALYGTKATKPAKFKRITMFPDTGGRVSASGMGYAGFHTMNTRMVMTEGWGVDIAELQQNVDDGNLF